MTDTDQDLLDRFAIAAMPIVSLEVAHNRMHCESKECFGNLCYSLALSMKQARDRIFQTAQPAQMEAGPFPPIDLEMINTVEIVQLRPKEPLLCTVGDLDGLEPLVSADGGQEG